MGFTQGSRGTAKADTSAATSPGGVQTGAVLKTPARNTKGYNPGGVGAAGVVKPTQAKSTPGGRKVIGQKGKTVAGTGKQIGTGGL